MIFQSLHSEGKINLENIKFMFGHSLGEYTALACSNKMRLKDCSLILKKRGELMNSAIKPNETGMAALIGLSASNVNDIIIENNIDLEIANDNSPLQVVISGSISEIDKNKQLFLDHNVKKYVKLNVSAAFHSKFMKEAEIKLNEDLDKINLYENNIEIISNFTSLPSSDSIEIKNSLKKQMSNKVRWAESVKSLESFNERKIIEIGPNKVLSGLIKRISNIFDIKSVTNIAEMNNL